jgi:hypothetical protein
MWIITEITDITEKKSLYGQDLYFIPTNQVDFDIIDYDVNQIRYYVQYLIKWMEGSRELASILINRYIQIFIVIILIFTMFLQSQRPNLNEIKEIINAWNNANIMTNFADKINPEIKLNENLNTIIPK